MARPRALNDSKRREVYALVSTGCSLSAAARYVGCCTRTIRREALRNQEFYDELRRAELACQVSPLRAVRRAAETHWRAAAWLLERTDPDRFARRKPAQLTPGDLEEFVDFVVGIISRGVTNDDDLRRVILELNTEMRHRFQAGRE